MTHSTDLLWSCEPSDPAAFRQAAIAKSAYFRAQQRGFAPGHEIEDWLAAEHEAYAQGYSPHAEHDLGISAIRIVGGVHVQNDKGPG
jgi:hypothetical protein